MNLFSNLFAKKKVENSASMNDSQDHPTRRCHQCNAPFDLNYTGGLCLDCWQKEYSLKKAFYSSYTVRLRNELHNSGIEVLDESTKGVLESGEPVCKVKRCADIDTIPLRENERALFTVSCRDSVFAFPDSGIGLRYLSIAPEDCEWARKIDAKESIMSICSDGRELYYLTEQGIIQSSSPEWNPKTLFDPIQECRTCCKSISGGSNSKTPPRETAK